MQSRCSGEWEDSLQEHILMLEEDKIQLLLDCKMFRTAAAKAQVLV